MLENMPPYWWRCPHIGGGGAPMFVPHVGGGAEGGEIVAGANFRAIDERSGHAAAINHRNRSSTSSARRYIKEESTSSLEEMNINRKKHQQTIDRGQNQIRGCLMFDWQGQANDHITDFCPPRSNQLDEQQLKIKACLDHKHYILTLTICQR